MICHSTQLTIISNRFLFIKANYFIIFLLMLGVVFANSAYAKTVQSIVSSATVYPDGALVTRVAEIDLNVGENSLTFSGLPRAMSGSVQVSVSDKDVKLGQVKIKRQALAESIDNDVNALKDELGQLQAKKQELLDSNKAAELQLKFIESVSQGYAKEVWSGGAKGSVNIDSWQAALGMVDKGVGAATKTIRNNSLAIKLLDKDISRVQRELNSAQGKRKAQTNVNLILSSPRVQRVTIELSYTQRNAGWSPAYEARLDSDTAKIELLQKATVYQNTDEDWKNIGLTLSTSAPSGELIMPEHSGEQLDIFDPSLVKKSYKARGASYGSSRIEEVLVQAESASDASLYDAPSPPARTAVELNNYSVEYLIPGKVSIANRRSDAEIFDLNELSIDSKLITQVRPRRSDQAFLVAKFRYESQTPLFSSDMAVFVDGVFVGNTYLETVLPGEAIELPMGQDRGIVVSVKQQLAQDSSKGIVSKKKVEETHYLYSIKNTRSQSALLEVFDYYPTAKNEQIQIKVDRNAAEPTSIDVDKIPGQIVWRKTLKPSEEWNIRQQYRVSYPEKYSLSRH